MISDEVITGFGRTGDWSGARHWGVQPDMMTTAKGITSAYFPVGATLLNAKVAETFESDQSGEGGIFHGYTYSAHPCGHGGGQCLFERDGASGPQEQCRSPGHPAP